MHTTTEITKRATTIRAIAGAAVLAALVLAALVLVKVAGSGDGDQQASAGEVSAADELPNSKAPIDDAGAELTVDDEADGLSRGVDDRRSIPPTSIVSTPNTTDYHPHLLPVDEGPFPRDPRNTPASWEVVVTPAHPVAGDEVTVEIFWSDNEADTIVAESWCHPGSGERPGLCADDFLASPCDAPVDPGVERKPGSGVLRFSFTPVEPGFHGWDHSVVIRSLPADLHEECTTYDPWQDVVFASGTIEVAPAPHGDVVVRPVGTVPVTMGDELAS